MNTFDKEVILQELVKLYWTLKLSLTIQLRKMNKIIKFFSKINELPIDKQIKLQRKIARLEIEVEIRRNFNEKMNCRVEKLKKILNMKKKK